MTVSSQRQDVGDDFAMTGDLVAYKLTKIASLLGDPTA